MVHWKAPGPNGVQDCGIKRLRGTHDLKHTIYPLIWKLLTGIVVDDIKEKIETNHLLPDGLFCREKVSPHCCLLSIWYLEPKHSFRRKLDTNSKRETIGRLTIHFLRVIWNCMGKSNKKWKYWKMWSGCLLKTSKWNLAYRIKVKIKRKKKNPCIWMFRKLGI